MNINATARKAAQKAIREALPEEFSPDSYDRVRVHVGNVQPGDLPIGPDWQPWSLGRVVQVLEWLDTDDETDANDWEKHYLAQTEGFVPLVKLVGYLPNPMVKGQPHECLEVFRPVSR